jgi:ABC-type multidrug transport system fused ATPase/permease subunit
MSTVDTDTARTKRSFVAVITSRLKAGARRIGKALSRARSATSTAVATVARATGRGVVRCVRVARIILAGLITVIGIVVLIPAMVLFALWAALMFLATLVSPKRKRIMEAVKDMTAKLEADLSEVEASVSRHPSAPKGGPTPKRPPKKRHLKPVVV